MIDGEGTGPSVTPPRRDLGPAGALLAIGLVFVIGVAIGFVLARTL